jgi:hypothetical protein
MFDPTSKPRDDTPISSVGFSARIQNVRAAIGLETIGLVREASYDMNFSLPDLGKRTVTHLRETLGLPSPLGVKSADNKS